MWEDMHLSENTVTMLKALIERKHKWDRLKHNTWWSAGGAVAFTLLIMVYYDKISKSSNVGFFFSQLTDKKFILLVLLAGMTVFMLKYYTREAKKAKEKYEKLRAETVKHLEKSEFTHRHQIAVIMKQKHRINIAYVG